MANQLKMAKSMSIQSLHRQGWSQRRIARELGVDRATVSRHLRRLEESHGCDTAAVESNAAKAPTGSGELPEKSRGMESKQLESCRW